VEGALSRSPPVSLAPHARDGKTLAGFRGRESPLPKRFHVDTTRDSDAGFPGLVAPDEPDLSFVRAKVGVDAPGLLQVLRRGMQVDVRCVYAPSEESTDRKRGERYKVLHPSSPLLGMIPL